MKSGDENPQIATLFLMKAACRHRRRRREEREVRTHAQMAKTNDYAPPHADGTIEWTRLKPNIVAILALNEKMPGDDVKYQASSVHLFFQVNISKDA